MRDHLDNNCRNVADLLWRQTKSYIRRQLRNSDKRRKIRLAESDENACCVRTLNRFRTPRQIRAHKQILSYCDQFGLRRLNNRRLEFPLQTATTVFSETQSFPICARSLAMRRRRLIFIVKLLKKTFTKALPHTIINA